MNSFIDKSRLFISNLNLTSEDGEVSTEKEWLGVVFPSLYITLHSERLSNSKTPV